MAPRELHESGAIVLFTHWDAVQTRKAGRPGVVDRLFAGNISIFYGSTFKRGGYPRDAIEVSPHAEPGSAARQLSNLLPGFVDEPTFFHGSLVAETSLRAKELKHLRGLGFPSDLLEDLQEQAEERLVGFLVAWNNMSWLAARSQILDALWWRARVGAEVEALLTLLLCDGWTVEEVESISWRDVDLGRRVASVRGKDRWLLPRTAGLLAALRRQSTTQGPSSAANRDELLEKLCVGWEAIVAAAKSRGRRSSLPTWTHVRAKIDR